MKSLVKLVVLCLFALFAHAVMGVEQSGANVTPTREPEIGKVYLLSNEGQLIPLEVQQIRMTTTTKALGFGGGTSMYLYSGATSNSKVAGPAALTFVVNLGKEDPVPDIISLNPLVSQKGQRFIILAKIKSFVQGLSVDQTSGPVDLDITFTKYGKSSYKVTTGVLQPGEYAFHTKWAKAFMFTVTSPPPAKIAANGQ